MPTTALARRSGSGRVTPKTASKKLPKGVVEFTDDGETFRLNGKINVFNLLAVTAGEDEGEMDTTALYRLILGMVEPEDRGRFKSHMSKKDDLDAEGLNSVMSAMFKAVSGRNPTDTSSDSALTPKRTTSRRLSAAN